MGKEEVGIDEALPRGLVLTETVLCLPDNPQYDARPISESRFSAILILEHAFRMDHDVLKPVNKIS